MKPALSTAKQIAMAASFTALSYFNHCCFIKQRTAIVKQTTCSWISHALSLIFFTLRVSNVSCNLHASVNWQFVVWLIIVSGQTSGFWNVDSSRSYECNDDVKDERTHGNDSAVLTTERSVYSTLTAGDTYIRDKRCFTHAQDTTTGQCCDW